MKCVIAQTKDNNAVIINEHGEFINISNKNYKIGQKIDYKPNSYSKFYHLVASIIILLMIGGFTGYSSYYTTVSYASVDINPSVQLELNRYNKIIKVNPLNDDANLLLNSINLKHHDIAEGINEIIDASKSMQYINEKNNSVEIDIVTKNDKIIDKVNENIDKFKADGIEISVYKCDENDLNEAIELGVSIGKAKAIIEYTNIFGGVAKENANKLDDMSVGQIKKTTLQNKELKIESTHNEKNEDKIPNSSDDKNINVKNNENNKNKVQYKSNDQKNDKEIINDIKDKDNTKNIEKTKESNGKKDKTSK